MKTLTTFVLAVLFSNIALCEPLRGFSPETWIDKDTGHRIWRLTNIRNANTLYFNIPSITKDERLVYISTDGISSVNIKTRESNLIVPFMYGDGIAYPLSISADKDILYFTSVTPATGKIRLYKVPLSGGEPTLLVELSKEYRIQTVNAEGSFAAGTLNTSPGEESAHQNNEIEKKALKKGEIFANKYQTTKHSSIFIINLRNSQIDYPVEAAAWIDHVQFSPTKSDILMYCHEGPWQSVDRIWTYNLTSKKNELMHKRTMAMEISGHEFWSNLGVDIYYDWQYPRGKNFFLAKVSVDSPAKIAYSVERENWSIHYNQGSNPLIFVGDGADAAQVSKSRTSKWIYLYHGKLNVKPDADVKDEYWTAGELIAEHLVNMAEHDYKLEPNARISIDGTLVIFRSNMFGPNQIFAVETSKSTGDQSDIRSTPELAQQYKQKYKPILISD